MPVTVFSVRPFVTADGCTVSTDRHQGLLDGYSSRVNR